MMKHKLDFEFYFSSIGLEEPYKGNSISVEKCHFVYDGHDIQNSILIKYNIPEKDWEPSLTPEEITQIIMLEADVFVNIFSLLLINPCDLLGLRIFIDDIEFNPKYQPQSLGGLYNLLIERNKFLVKQNLTTIVHKKGWFILEEIILSFQTNLLLEDNRILLALRWCRKASKEYSSIDRLVSYWISFNSLYEGLAERSEQRSIEKFIDDEIDELIAKRLYKNYQKKLSILSSLSIELRNRRNISEDLNTLLHADIKDFNLIIKTALLVIYGIRNNLFHGSYNPQLSDVKKSIYVAESILSEFMKEVLSRKIIGYSLASSVFRYQTKAGF